MSKKITPEASVLDIVAEHPETQDVFRAFDREAGCCIMCEHLFESLEEMAGNCGLDLGRLMGELEKSIH